MSAAISGNIQKAQHWLLLKQAWIRWQQGHPMPDLPDETRSYFEGLSFYRFNELLTDSEFEGVPPVATPREAWAHVLRCFTTRRPIASLFLLDDIFGRARDRARELGIVGDDDRIEFYVGVLVNQFHMRMAEAVAVYARDFGTLGARRRKVSLDAPVQGQDGDQDRTRLDFATLPENWGTETEQTETGEIGLQVAMAYFPGIRPAFKLSIFLRSLRLRRCVIISCGNKTVLDLAGLGRATFADGAKNILERDFPLHVLGQPACTDLDQAGRYQLCLSATIALLDKTELWLWLAAWLKELGQEREDMAAAQFAERARAFVTLLAEALRVAGDHSSENDIRGLFQRIKELS